MPRNERLRHHRDQRNWRQQDVADELGVSLATVQRWERGIQEPSAYYRAKLCALFGLSAQELGLLDTPSTLEASEQAASAPVSPAPSSIEKLALWTIPLARNPHFTGRDELLAQLEQQFALREAGICQVALTQASTIKGLGGVGKTQLAVEYAYRSQEQGRYTHTLWINAASEEALLASVVALAEDLPTLADPGGTDQHKLATAVIRWLEECSQPWLLIYDNADDLIFIPAYLPVRGNGHILFTTRASAVSAFAPPIEVDSMGLAEATQLLLRRSQREGIASEEEIDDATNIAVALAQFPLALDQAGAYIEETKCSLREYLHLYHQHQYTLLARRGTQANRYPDSVATTWSLSFAQVERANPAAAELLSLCAFLFPDQIPEELLTEGTPHWPPALQTAAADPFHFNQMVEILMAFSLVKRMGEQRLLRIHRLVQTVQRERLSAEAQHQWAKRIVCAVYRVFPRDSREAPSWPQCERYLDQVQACERLIQEQQILLPEAAKLLDRTGIYLRERALYALAEPLHQQALYIWEQQMPPDTIGQVSSLQSLANLYSVQGKYAKAEPLFQKAVDLLEQHETSEPVLLATLLKGLGDIFNNRAEFTQAETLYRRALLLLEQHNPEHSSVRSILTAWAWAQMEQGRYAEAEHLSQRALHLNEQHYGEMHLQVVPALLVLGQISVRQRKYPQAEALYQRALHIREQQLGSEHPLVAMVLFAIAKLYGEQGKFAQAEPLFLEALRIREQQMGLESRQVADSLRALAECYTNQGKYNQAEPLFQRALRIREQVFGPNSGPVSDVLLGLARIAFQQGELVQAEPLFQQALQTREQHYGPAHVETAEALHDVAGFRQVQGRTQEAIVLYQRALAIREQVLGPDDPATCDTRERLQAASVVLGYAPETIPLDGKRNTPA